MAKGNQLKLRIQAKNPPLSVELTTTSSIIYLTGKNGAGKSRFIDSLRDNRGYITAIYNTNTEREVPFRYFEWGKPVYDHLKVAETKFKDINNALRVCEQAPIEMMEKGTEKREEFVGGEWKLMSSTSYRPVLRKIDFRGLPNLSEGTRKYYELFNWSIRESFSDQIFPQRYNRRSPELMVVGIEEPENSLHPKVQKKIPQLLESWISRQSLKVPILIVVSTHSPFVIKGASDFAASQTVYGLNDCNLINLTGGDDETTAQNGVSGSQALIVANELLGSGIGDFFPNPILLTETSVHELLKGLSKSTGHSIDEFVVTAGGDGDINKRIGNLEQMVKMLRQMHRSYPERNLFKFKVIIVADDKEKEKEWQSKFQNLHDFEVEVYGLGEKQLEDIYPQDFIADFIKENYPEAKPWDKAGLINDYISAELGLSGRQKGEFKGQMAKYVSSQITNLDDLNKKLNPVHSLLKAINVI